ncbi:MAG: hypothetical protein PHY64_01700 [Eubacteriales bacterium]|nr:hypothetical protein [Eubacteriales bacterium]
MIKKLLPHICIILSLVTLTFLVLDQFNPTFFGKSFFHVVLLIDGIVTIVFSSVIIAHNKRD